MISIYVMQTQKEIYVLGHSFCSCSFCLCLKVLWYIKHCFVSAIMQLTAAVHLHQFGLNLKNLRLLFFVAPGIR
jgi:predicted nucleic acid-binding Zn finger protein